MEIRQLQIPPETTDQEVQRTIAHDPFELPQIDNDPEILLSILTSLYEEQMITYDLKGNYLIPEI